MLKYFKKIDIFGRNVILVLAGTTLANVFNLLYQLLIAHSLSPADFAAFNALLSLFVLISSPLSTLQIAVAKTCSQFHCLGRIDKMHALLSGLFKKLTALAIITLLIFYLFSPYITNRLKINSLASGYFLALLMALSWLMPVFLGAIQAREMFKWLSSVILITAALKLILSAVFLYFGFNVAGAMAALLFSILIGIGISILPMKDVIFSQRASDDKASSADFKELFLYIFPVALSLFCFMGLVNMDMVLVKYYFSPRDSGLYSLAQMVGKIVLFLPAAISLVMFPKASSLNTKKLDTGPILRRSLLYATGLCVLCALFYNLLPVFVLKVLTGKVYIESIVLGRLFSFSMLFFALVFILINYFLSLKDLRFLKYLTGFTLLQFLAIIFFHHNIFQVQLILCINSLLLFSIHMGLAKLKNNLAADIAV